MLIKRRSVLKGFVGAATAPVFLNSLTAEAAGNGGLIVVVVG